VHSCTADLYRQDVVDGLITKGLRDITAGVIRVPDVILALPLVTKLVISEGEWHLDVKNIGYDRCYVRGSMPCHADVTLFYFTVQWGWLHKQMAASLLRLVRVMSAALFLLLLLLLFLLLLLLLLLLLPCYPPAAAAAAAAVPWPYPTHTSPPGAPNPHLPPLVADGALHPLLVLLMWQLLLLLLLLLSLIR
jgi:hypothetical protein